MEIIQQHLCGHFCDGNRPGEFDLVNGLFGRRELPRQIPNLGLVVPVARKPEPGMRVLLLDLVTEINQRVAL